MKPLTNYDRQLLKSCYGGVKQYKQFKKDQRSYELSVIEINERVKESSKVSQYKENMRISKELDELRNNKQEVQNILIKLLPYNEYIIMYDLFNHSYYNFNKDINTGKITKNNIDSVIDKINAIHNIINKEVVFESMLYN